MKRTHNNGDLRKDQINQKVSLLGWVHRRRDHGGLVFIDLRDRSGLVQIVFKGEDKNLLAEAEKLANQIELSEEEKNQIERDVFELVGSDLEKDEPVVLDLETIRVKKPGQYELDLVHLFKGDPLIFRLEEGKYLIDLAESFKRTSTKKNRKK